MGVAPEGEGRAAPGQPAFLAALVFILGSSRNSVRAEELS